MHPARLVSFQDLAEALEARVRTGAVARTDDGPLRIYVYTNRCVYDAMWDEVSVLARGIVLDREAGLVRATPFPKFFNYGEHGITAPDEPFTAYEKVDGSLAIVFHDGTRWRAVTKGAFDSPQAKWATDWIATRADSLVIGDTYLFEAIFAENRIVVRYDYEGMVLLSAFAEAGHEYSRAELESLAERIDSRIVQVFEFDSMAAMIANCESLDATREGYVVRFESGMRLKLKGSAYRRIHAIISNITPLGLWRAWYAGDDLDSIRKEVPEEFYADFDSIRSLLQDRVSAVKARVEALHVQWADRSDRELGLALNEIPGDTRKYLFGRRKRGVAWDDDPGLRGSVLREIRPDGNVLEGYSPSFYMLGAMDPEG